MVPPALDVIEEEETVEEVAGGDDPSEGATPAPTTSPPEVEQEQPMETNPLASPVSPHEDNLLSGGTADNVEEGLASLRVTSSPEGQEDEGQASG